MIVSAETNRLKFVIRELLWVYITYSTCYPSNSCQESCWVCTAPKRQRCQWLLDQMCVYVGCGVPHINMQSRETIYVYVHIYTCVVYIINYLIILLKTHRRKRDRRPRARRCSRILRTSKAEDLGTNSLFPSPSLHWHSSLPASQPLHLPNFSTLYSLILSLSLSNRHTQKHRERDAWLAGRIKGTCRLKQACGWPL